MNTTTPIKETSALPILFFSLAFYESNNFTSLEDQQKTRQTVLLQNLTSNHLSVLDIEINGYMCFFSVILPIMFFRVSKLHCAHILTVKFK